MLMPNHSMGNPVIKRVKKLSKHVGAVSYSTKSESEWVGKLLYKTSKLVYKLFCSTCSRECSCAHQEEADIKHHIASKSHANTVLSLLKQPTINFVPQNDPIIFKTPKVKVLMTNFTVENILLISEADKCGLHVRGMFPD